MAQAKHNLTAAEVKALTPKPGQAVTRKSDGAGLTLLIKCTNDTTNKYWVLRYRDPVSGKENTKSLGTYPNVSLKDARTAASKLRRQLSKGIAPKDQARKEKEALRAARLAEKHTFKAVAEAWYQECIEDGLWSSDKHARIIKESFENHIYPSIGDQPIADITASQIRAVIRKLGRAGTWETAQRVLQRIRTVYQWAEDEDRVQSIPTRPATKWLKRNRPEQSRKRSYPALSPQELPELARALETDADWMDRQTYLALQLLALTFVRPGELQKAEWSEIDVESRLWLIPAHKMKMKREHAVPLSMPALAVLEELRGITGNRKWLFPGRVSPRKPMSEGTLRMALQRLKPDTEDQGSFQGRHVPHGFRHTASTYLNEYTRADGTAPYRGDVVEVQLAHQDRNTIRAAYNKAQHLELRRQMMDTWADFWLRCKAPADTVVDIREAAHG